MCFPKKGEDVTILRHCVPIFKFPAVLYHVVFGHYIYIYIYIPLFGNKGRVVFTWIMASCKTKQSANELEGKK